MTRQPMFLTRNTPRSTRTLNVSISTDFDSPPEPISFFSSQHVGASPGRTLSAISQPLRISPMTSSRSGCSRTSCCSTSLESSMVCIGNALVSPRRGGWHGIILGNMFLNYKYRSSGYPRFCGLYVYIYLPIYLHTYSNSRARTRRQPPPAARRWASAWATGGH
ncbi:hypothetical protein XACS584_1640005 [Xanthomonas citri pv. citri]|nr:hypothetical protein XAC2911_1350010 [Xanthomonas citri pv. citri]CEE52182.1 hypothetical protein XAC71A_1420007 [Xanthomonas citri pv. citri]CEE56835.1 hypothetical protein XACS584_1640005 [Xanthomonas citri pv. citri]CEF43482.1 hypothetical protein XAC217_1100010 [Xanthomonas citri pv. citri]CEL35672.1 hypothetical protein XAC4311_2460007 [Xanthomonas citri pv. citri]